jgi:hypothetical protein
MLDEHWSRNKALQQFPIYQASGELRLGVEWRMHWGARNCFGLKARPARLQTLAECRTGGTWHFSRVVRVSRAWHALSVAPARPTCLASPALPSQLTRAPRFSASEALHPVRSKPINA